MTEQRTAARISSFVTPNENDLACFDNLSAGEQRALLQAEIDKGFGGLGDRSVDQIVAQARANSLVRCGSNG